MALNIKPLEGPKHPYTVEELSPSDSQLKQLMACAHPGMDSQERERDARLKQQKRIEEIIAQTKWYRKLWVIS